MVSADSVEGDTVPAAWMVARSELRRRWVDTRIGENAPMLVPETRFAHAQGVDIAYQVFGQGPVELVWVPGWISHVEVMWELAEFARFLEHLATFSRVVTFDKRGTGFV